MRSQPRARTCTLVTPSGRRSSAGRRTAWLRLWLMTLLVLMAKAFAYDSLQFRAKARSGTLEQGLQRR